MRKAKPRPRPHRWVFLRGQRTKVYPFRPVDGFGRDGDDTTALLFEHGRGDGGPVLFVKTWAILDQVVAALSPRH